MNGHERIDCRLIGCYSDPHGPWAGESSSFGALERGWAGPQDTSAFVSPSFITYIHIFFLKKKHIFFSLTMYMLVAWLARLAHDWLVLCSSPIH